MYEPRPVSVRGLLLALSLVLTSCVGVDADVDLDDEGAFDEDLVLDDPDPEGKADGPSTLWYTQITREYFLPSAKVRKETRKLFKSEDEWVAHFGTPSPGIDFTDNWAIFYTPGTDNLEVGDRARFVKVTLSGTGRTVSITTRLERNGACAWRSARPFVTATIRKPASNPDLKRFFKSDTTRACD